MDIIMYEINLGLSLLSDSYGWPKCQIILLQLLIICWSLFAIELSIRYTVSALTTVLKCWQVNSRKINSSCQVQQGRALELHAGRNLPRKPLEHHALLARLVSNEMWKKSQELHALLVHQDNPPEQLLLEQVLALEHPEGKALYLLLLCIKLTIHRQWLSWWRKIYHWIILVSEV